MTTITIDRALLEQALESLWQMTKKFNFERLHESRLSDSNVRVSAHDAMNAIRAELAKPVEQQLPAWHDAPTEPGIWLCDEGGPDCYTYTAHNIVLLNDPAMKDDECRWYGPIPQDTKAEGGAG